MCEESGEIQSDTERDDPQNDLRSKYLDGEIDHLEFLEKLLELDQHDNDARMLRRMLRFLMILMSPRSSQRLKTL